MIGSSGGWSILQGFSGDSRDHREVIKNVVYFTNENLSRGRLSPGFMKLPD
ncbi:MAG: hypothetical protein K2J65_09420 [Duncaniella sp.]|nr:hypothetical protein [Duncaniella sp.]